jgi:hypothetical protein
MQGPGVKREWFSILTKEILNPCYGLFHITDSSVYQPYSQSGINTDHLSYFHFVGTMIGLAIYHEQVRILASVSSSQWFMQFMSRCLMWRSRSPFTSIF